MNQNTGYIMRLKEYRRKHQRIFIPVDSSGFLNTFTIYQIIITKVKITPMNSTPIIKNARIVSNAVIVPSPKIIQQAKKTNNDEKISTAGKNDKIQDNTLFMLLSPFTQLFVQGLQKPRYCCFEIYSVPATIFIVHCNINTFRCIVCSYFYCLFPIKLIHHSTYESA